MRLLTSILVVFLPLGILGQFDLITYRKMPPLYILDDYDECLASQKPSSYCSVIGEIIPNATSPLWNQIADFSADTRHHFRHDYIQFGLCLNPCRELMKNLSASQKDLLYTGGITQAEVVEFFSYINKQESDTLQLNEKEINTCLNYKFENKYALKVRTFTQNCVTNEPPPKYDFLEIAFMVLIGTLLFLSILSSTYDRQLKNKQSSNMQGTEFYQKPLKGTQLDSYLAAFSIFRNYYLLSKPSTSSTARDFRFLEAYRFVSTMGVVLAHVALVIKSMAVKNPEFMEKVFHTTSANFLINGTVIIQIFFVMSSFLLCFNFQQTMASKNPGLKDWGQMIFNRYLRLLPSVGFVILLSATVLPRFQDGPSWRNTIQAEYVFCRESWWKNLLLINNFDLKKSCVQQTWYVATDFQLYVLLAAVLILIAKFPKTQNYVLGGGVVLSFVITGMVTYFLKLNGIHQETPDSYRWLFWTDGSTMYQGYIPFYMNLGGFFCGTIAALVYRKYKNEGLDLKGKKSKLNYLVYTFFPVAILLLLSGSIFYHFDIKYPSIWPAVYAALHRNIWALMSSAILVLMCFRVGSLMYRFASMKMFVPLGRLSFQVYLIHSIVIRCMVGCIRQPIYINNMILLMYFVAATTISFVLAFLLYIFLEMPFSTIVHLAFKAKPARTTISNQVETNGKR